MFDPTAFLLTLHMESITLLLIMILTQSHFALVCPLDDSLATQFHELYDDDFVVVAVLLRLLGFPSIFDDVWSTRAILRFDPLGR